MSHLTISPANTPLQGTVIIPGDKSITHRGLILGALAEGETSITGYSHGEDCLNTLKVIRQLGIEVDGDAHSLLVKGKGLRGLSEPQSILDCGNSGTGMRLLAGVLAGQGFFSVLTGDSSLRGRPMRRVVTPLREMGAEISGRQGGELAPLAINGRELHAIHYRSPVASAQIKSCVLLAGLSAEGVTVVEEPSRSRDHTERLFAYLGLPITVSDRTVSIEGKHGIEGKPITVPGDISAAAFFMVAASLVPGSEVFIPNVGLNPERTGILEILLKMGADITVSDLREVSGEPVGDMCIRSARLKGLTIGADMVPKTIDEFPILCVAAAFADGQTRITDAQELRVKETDRIHAMATQLKKLNVAIEEQPDGLLIDGNAQLTGGNCESFGDHRVVMSLAVAGLLGKTSTTIEDVECVETSFPGFHGKLLDLLTKSE